MSIESSAPTALIIGITGQDGAYLANILLNKGYRVIGTSRDAENCNVENLRRLGIAEQLSIRSVSPTDFQNIYNAISETRPHEIYNLAGLTSVSLSFEQPAVALESISLGTLNLLESVRSLNIPTRIFVAGSGECFGNTTEPASENTPFRPASPYAIAKTSAFWLVKNYRKAYNIFACTGILFNHESPLRPTRFVTKKIVETAKAIAAGEDKKLVLGNISVIRDWGWAPEYVDAMWRMLQQSDPDDFIIATGHSHSLELLVEYTFGLLDLNWIDHTSISENLNRPMDIAESRANPRKALDILNWQATVSFREIIQKLIREELFL